MGKGETGYRLEASEGGLCSQSLEFVADMRILAEMKIKNCRKKFDKHTFFFYENKDDGSVNAN